MGDGTKIMFFVAGLLLVGLYIYLLFLERDVRRLQRQVERFLGKEGDDG